MSIRVSSVTIESKCDSNTNWMTSISIYSGYVNGVTLNKYGKHAIVKNLKTGEVEVLSIPDLKFLEALKLNKEYLFILQIDEDAKFSIFNKI